MWKAQCDHHEDQLNTRDTEWRDDDITRAVTDQWVDRSHRSQEMHQSNQGHCTAHLLERYREKYSPIAGVTDWLIEFTFDGGRKKILPNVQDWWEQRTRVSFWANSSSRRLMNTLTVAEAMSNNSYSMSDWINCVSCFVRRNLLSLHCFNCLRWKYERLITLEL